MRKYRELVLFSIDFVACLACPYVPESVRNASYEDAKRIFRGGNRTSAQSVAGTNQARLFPLDSRRRFRADVVNNAVDALHFVDDVVRDFCKEVVGQSSPVGCHAIG